MPTGVRTGVPTAMQTDVPTAMQKGVPTAMQTAPSNDTSERRAVNATVVPHFTAKGVCTTCGAAAMASCMPTAHAHHTAVHTAQNHGIVNVWRVHETTTPLTCTIRRMWLMSLCTSLSSVNSSYELGPSSWEVRGGAVPIVRRWEVRGEGAAQHQV
eukprot:363440-Chlamydomonas_euryale.AAC.8